MKPFLLLEWTGLLIFFSLEKHLPDTIQVPNFRGIFFFFWGGRGVRLAYFQINHQFNMTVFRIKRATSLACRWDHWNLWEQKLSKYEGHATKSFFSSSPFCSSQHDLRSLLCCLFRYHGPMLTFRTWPLCLVELITLLKRRLSPISSAPWPLSWLKNR